ncbi:hypothetical protein BpHYR1_039379 [Brachionus plicatilis]|uniref:Uncharacterized protein n=1 Tax=Brachionus plicatilis TaxID=10195 RepID=A0A3M7SU72_BRAPC|nr:hypothetical protein BpHYR1_039379 [Brachionus plicatilis]
MLKFTIFCQVTFRNCFYILALLSFKTITMRLIAGKSVSFYFLKYYIRLIYGQKLTSCAIEFSSKIISESDSISISDSSSDDNSRWFDLFLYRLDKILKN